MLDSNGSNTTAVAAVAKLRQAAGDVQGLRALSTAWPGPGGVRAAGLLAHAGADVLLTSRKRGHAALLEQIQKRFGGTTSEIAMNDASQRSEVLEGAALRLNAGPAGVCLVPRSAWAGRP